jgi:hypothetical protein
LISLRIPIPPDSRLHDLTAEIGRTQGAGRRDRIIAELQMWDLNGPPLYRRASTMTSGGALAHA